MSFCLNRKKQGEAAFIQVVRRGHVFAGQRARSAIQSRCLVTRHETSEPVGRRNQKGTIVALWWQDLLDNYWLQLLTIDTTMSSLQERVHWI